MKPTRLRASFIPLLVLVLVLVACSHQSHPRDMPLVASPRLEDPSQRLWNFAPPETRAALVAPPGGAARAIDGIGAVVAAAYSIKQFAAEDPGHFARIRQRWGFNPFDAEAWKAAGLDWSRGFAVFLDGRGRMLLTIMPIADEVRAAHFVRATRTTIGGRKILQLVTGPVCSPIEDDLWACVPDASLLEGVRPNPASALPRAASARPDTMRGDVNVYINLNDFAPATSLAGLLSAAVQQPGILWAAATLDRAHPSLRVKVAGTGPGPLAPSLRPKPPATWEVDAARGASGVLRATLPVELLSGLVPAVDTASSADAWRGILRHLSGPVLVISRGTGIISGQVLASVGDTEAVSRAVDDQCADAALHAPKQYFKIDGTSGACRIALRGLPISLTSEVHLAHDRLSISVGGAGEAPATGEYYSDLAGSPATREMLTGPAGFVLWTRTLPGSEILATFTLPGIDVRGPLREALQIIALTGRNIYDAGLAISVEGNELRMVVAANTFAGDPPGARATYAQSQEYALDRARWLETLTSIESQFPRSLLARHAAELRDGAPIVGPIGAVMIWLLQRN